jgi:hypothetical protein
MKEKKNILSVYVPDALRAKLKARADKEGRSVSNLVTVLLEKEVRKEKAA